MINFNNNSGSNNEKSSFNSFASSNNRSLYSYSSHNGSTGLSIHGQPAILHSNNSNSNFSLQSTNSINNNSNNNIPPISTTHSYQTRSAAQKNQQLQQQQQQQNRSLPANYSYESAILTSSNHANSLPQTPKTVDHSLLSNLEVQEIGAYESKIYYYGQNCRNKRKALEEYDDQKGDYCVLAGDQIAYRYEILEVLGKGSFGQVAACLDHRSREKVAVKIIRNKKRFHQQALIEVKILEQLKDIDPNDEYPIIKLHSHFYFRGHLCIVFPLLSVNLYEFIKSHNFVGFPLSLVRKFCLQITSSLLLLYRQNIIHCDLKPENILLTAANKSFVRVIDFGSSCYVSEKVYTYIQSRFYRSPEIVLGLSYGPPIDMWSLGCILAELYTGYPLFPAQDEHELMACLMEVLGVPPLDIIAKSTRRKLFFHSNNTPRLSTDSKGRMRRPNTKSLDMILKCNSIQDSHNHTAFLDFVRKCLTWDPDFRMNPEEAMRHPFLNLETSISNLKLSSPAKARTNMKLSQKASSKGLPSVTASPHVTGLHHAMKQQTSSFRNVPVENVSSRYQTRGNSGTSSTSSSTAGFNRKIGGMVAATRSNAATSTSNVSVSREYYLNAAADKRKNNSAHSIDKQGRYDSYVTPPKPTTQQSYQYQQQQQQQHLLSSYSNQESYLKKNNSGSWSSLLQGGLTKLISGFRNTLGASTSRENLTGSVDVCKRHDDIIVAGKNGSVYNGNNSGFFKSSAHSSTDELKGVTIDRTIFPQSSNSSSSNNNLFHSRHATETAWQPQRKYY